MVALYNSNTPPSNWTNVTELQSRYLKGAGTGADADLTTNNGSSTNLHSITHTHTASNHTHTATSSVSLYPPTRQAFGGGIDHSVGGSVNMYWNHTHAFTTDGGAETVNQNTSTLTTGETVEPAYAILQAIKKGASGLKAKGIIGLWLGAVANIPKGWVLSDGTNGTKDLRDKFIKIGDPAGANGGANTHTHAAQAHSHTGVGHTHTASMTHSLVRAVDGSGPWGTARDGTHTMTSVQSVAAGYAAANTTADSSSNQPSYRTAVYIEFQKEVGGGSFILNLLANE